VLPIRLRLAVEWDQYEKQRREHRTQKPEFVRGASETTRVGSAGLNSSSTAATMVAQAKAAAASRTSKWDSNSRR
jgi:hypothetical protein